MYAYFKFFIPTHNNSYSPKNTVLEPILISISLKSKSDDTSYCCRVYHSPRNVPYYMLNTQSQDKIFCSPLPDEEMPQETHGNIIIL